jgi:hypothetical protein
MLSREVKWNNVSYEQEVRPGTRFIQWGMVVNKYNFCKISVGDSEFYAKQTATSPYNDVVTYKCKLFLWIYAKDLGVIFYV